MQREASLAALARHPGACVRGYFGPSFLSHTPPFGIHPAEASQPAAFSPRDSEGWEEGARPGHAMAARTVPHAYPMSCEYEFANPSKIYDQNFGEGKEGAGIPPLPCTFLPSAAGGLVEFPLGSLSSRAGSWRRGILSAGTQIKSGGKARE